MDANPSYGFWGWLALFSGMTGEPKKIVWKCRRCNEIVAQTTKKKDLRAFR